MLGALKVYARAGQGTIVTPFILAGAMSPVTVAGTLTQVLAEVLAGAALTQLCRPGAPVLMGCFAASISMQSGAPTFGTPEPSLVSYGAAQLARRLGIPFRTGGGLCASKVADAQAAYESANTLNTTLLAGTNFVLHAAGWLEGGLSSGYEKFVMDCDQLAMLQRFAEGVDLTENGQALSAIREVGPGSHYLGCQHTQDNFETAFYRSTIADNNSFEQWLAEGEKTAEQRANPTLEEMARRIRGAAARSGHRRGAEGVRREEEGVDAGRVRVKREPVEGSAEVLALQIVVAALAMIPTATGAAGLVLGPAFLGSEAPRPVDLDSHFRFLSGVFLAIGMGFLSTVPRIRERTARFRLLAALIFAGGLARLVSLGIAGAPSGGHIAGLAMELVGVPILVLWQARLAARSG